MLKNNGKLTKQYSVKLVPVSQKEKNKYPRENPFQTAVNAISETNFPSSVPTACRSIKLESELKSCSAAKKYKLSEEKKQGRIIFALNL